MRAIHSADPVLSSPSTPSGASADPVVAATLFRLDPTALGGAFGLVLATTVLLVTLVVQARGTPELQRVLSLLDHFFVGYSVTPAGGGVGFAYGFAAGFLFGVGTALLRNLFVAAFLALAEAESDLAELSGVIDGEDLD